MDVGMTVNLELHYCIIIEVKLSIVFKICSQLHLCLNMS